MTTHQQRSSDLARQARDKKRATRFLVGMFAFISLLIVIMSDNPMMNLALLGTIWLAGFCLVQIDLHIHAFLEIRTIIHNFYAELDKPQTESVESDKKHVGLSAQDAAEFNDLVQRYHSS